MRSVSLAFASRDRRVEQTLDANHGVEGIDAAKFGISSV
jgi:hypothetical protein